MAKAGMRRPGRKQSSPNDAAPVPEIQGKAKTGHQKAGNIQINKENK